MHTPIYMYTYILVDRLIISYDCEKRTGSLTKTRLIDQ